MEETLKLLSGYQIEALKKGISFDIDLHYNSRQVPTADVKMHYSVTGGIVKTYVFDTTFSENMLDSKKEHRLSSIAHFISTVTGPIENE